MSNISRNGIGAAQSVPPRAEAPQQVCEEVAPSVSDAVAHAGLCGMLATMRGQLPLKVGRVACQFGELAIKAVVASNEYETPHARNLPGLPASGEVVNETPATSRES